MQLEPGFRFITDVIPKLPRMVTHAFTLIDFFQFQRNNLVIEFRLFNHDLNRRTGSIGSGMNTGFNGHFLCQRTGFRVTFITVISHNMTVISDIAAPSAAKAMHRIKVSTGIFAECAAQPGELPVPKVNFKTKDVVAAVANETLDVSNVSLCLFHVHLCCDPGGSCVNGHRRGICHRDGYAVGDA